MKKVAFAGERLFMKFGDLDYFRERLKEADAEAIPVPGWNDEELIEEAGDAEAIVVIARKISGEIIGNMKNLKFIMTLSVGYDCVDVAAATEAGIPVSNSPTYCSDDVANHTMALLLAVSRKIHLLIPEVNKANWDYTYSKPIFNYTGKKLAILGLGKIGRKLVPKAKGFGMEVIAYDPYIADDIFELAGAGRRYELNQLLQEADYLSLHTPLTPESRYIIGRKELNLMKPSSIIINTARGSLIQETALVQALAAGEIAGAGIDVLEEEPITPGNPLLAEPKALITPHIAWYSEESFEANKVLGMDELVGVLNGHRPRYIVNPEIFGGKSAG
jgi:D-3-phosphoglycerate dehydrogenase